MKSAVPHVHVVAGLVCLAGLGHSAFGAGGGEVDPKMFLANYCYSCHGPEKQKSGVRLDHLTGDMQAHPQEVEEWSLILELVEYGDMPPRKAKQPTADERDAVVTWIQAHAEEALELIDRRMRFPENGNRVPHEKLFDPATAEAAPEIAASPARFWRILPRTYNKRQFLWNKSMQVQRGEQVPAPAPFGLYVKHELKDYSSLYTIESSEAEALANNARTMLGYITRPMVRFDQNKLQGQFLAEEGKKAGRKLGHRDLATDKELSARFAAFLDQQRKIAEQLPDEPVSTRSLLAVLAYKLEPPTDDELDQVITDCYSTWMQRPPTGKELASRRDYIRSKIDQFGNRQGLIYGLVPVLIDPESVFTFEFGDPQAVDKPTMLRPKELADALTRALDDEASGQTQFHKLATAGRLQSREDVREALVGGGGARSLALSNTVRRFLDEFFVYGHSDYVFKCAKDIDQQAGNGKDIKRNPYFEGWRSGKDKQMPNLTNAADRLVLDILTEDRQVLARLLAEPLVYYEQDIESYRADLERELARGLGYLKDAEERLAKLKAEGAPADQIAAAEGHVEMRRNAERITKSRKQLAWLENRDLPDRMGMLTTRAWLVAMSTNMDNHAIHRGKWIRERLLGQVIPEVPIGVDAALPSAPEKTLRERMEKTRPAECWICHEKMDPLGLPFERFDHFGSWRDEEKGKPVVTSGAIVDSGDPSIDGPVSDHEELLRKLASSQRVEQSFVRHAFRFWMGRNETLEDARTIQDAWRAYHDNDGSMHHMLLSLLTSDAFLYRRGALPIDPEVAHAP